MTKCGNPTTQTHCILQKEKERCAVNYRSVYLKADPATFFVTHDAVAGKHRVWPPSSKWGHLHSPRIAWPGRRLFRIWTFKWDTKNKGVSVTFCIGAIVLDPGNWTSSSKLGCPEFALMASSESRSTSSVRFPQFDFPFSLPGGLLKRRRRTTMANRNSMEGWESPVTTQDRVFPYYAPNSSIKHSKSDSKDRSQEILWSIKQI
jgi:hypothetical protein